MKYPLLLLAALAFAPASLAQPCTTEWAAPTDGDWTEAANWTAGVPGADDTACILVPGTYTVSFSGTQGLQELRLGGTSGTQTLVVGGTFSPLGGGTVGPNGRITLTNSQACAACDGLPNVSDTLLVEGGVVLPSQVGLLTNGGTLDIAPGGVVTVTGGAMAGGAGALFRVRGTLEASGCGPPSGGNNCFVDAPVEVDGGTVQALGGVFRVRGGGTLGDASVHAAEGAFLWLTRSTGVDRYVVEGTLSGAPVGEVRLLSADLAAGPDDATLAVGGSGLLLQGSFAGTSYLTSAGGAFVNTGRLIQATNTFTGFRSVVLRNRGVMEEAFGFDLLDGALVRNEPEGVIRLANVGVEGNGRLENAGLIVSEGAGSSVGFGGLLWSEAGSEIRALGGPRIVLEPPASRALPDGAALTGSGEVSLAGAFAYEGTVSPGTDDAPIATLSAFGTFRASSEGLPQLVIDLDAGGQSDRVDVIGANAGTVRAGGALVLRMRPGYTPAIGDEFTVLTSSFEVDGQFDVVAASGAPEGIAFVAETVAAGSGEAVTVRAVQAATDGPITVSETAPVGGAVRPIFLTGPGAGGVTAARLDCTTCLDPDAWGSIPATVTGTETFKEARFDLTSPRVFGLYDLVIQRPGLPDEVVPVTVRPYLSYVIAEQGLTVGARTRPPGFGYNVSRLQMEAHTNADEPAYHVPQVVRSTDLYALSLTLVNPFDGGLVSYESDEALDPDRAPVVFGRLREGAATPLTIGLRISPEDVLFPEQTPTGPDDPRIPFGDPTQFSAAFGPIHLSSARTTTLIGEALRTSGHAGLSSYIASVDAADAEAAETAVRNTLLFTGGRYYTLAEELLGEIIEALDPIVSAPAGLAAAAGLDFEMALEAAAFAFADEVEAAHTEALMEAPPAVADLFSAEVAALFPDGPPGGGRLTRPAVLRSGQGRRPGSQRGDLVVQTRCDFQKNADTVGAWLDDIEGGSTGDFNGGAGGSSGGANCPNPPSGPVDPNDKLAESNLTCEYGTVVVDGEEQTRCVRYFLPLEQTDAPLYYTVTFENDPEATADAEFVTITDEIDPNLDLATLAIESTSSASTFSYTVEGRTVTFRFVGIDLPPNVNPPEGEGYVKFSLVPNAGLEPGTEIRNDASIVFDFNPSIETAEVLHEVRQVADLAAIVTAPDESEVGSTVTFTAAVINLRGDAAGETVLTIVPPDAPLVSVTTPVGECNGTAPIVCEFGGLSQGGVGPVEVVVQPEAQGELTLSAAATTTAFDGFAANDADAASVTVVTVGTEDEDAAFPREVTLVQPYPNPSRGTTTLRWGLPEPGRADVRVYDLLGREVMRLVEDAPTPPGWHTTAWRAEVASGVYVVRLAVEADGQTTHRTRRLVVLR